MRRSGCADFVRPTTRFFTEVATTCVVGRSVALRNNRKKVGEAAQIEYSIVEQTRRRGARNVGEWSEVQRLNLEEIWQGENNVSQCDGAYSNVCLLRGCFNGRKFVFACSQDAAKEAGNAMDLNLQSKRDAAQEAIGERRGRRRNCNGSKLFRSRYFDHQEMVHLQSSTR